VVWPVQLGDKLEAGPPLPTGHNAPRLERNAARSNRQQAAVSNSRVLRPALFNESRFGYKRFFNNLSSELASVRDVVFGALEK